ncbi:hypothetical protein GGQ00_003037 [Salinibacter ruber]|uniref:hypothetical protein n=1 Tax=Salinibacter ruber TaxID=146919 RepID=UPI002169A466|nr:hypothetical protein [Salinibacter ruber]MCS4044577.1 hypothetical protein [Salinibacter ruber]
MSQSGGRTDSGEVEETSGVDSEALQHIEEEIGETELKQLEGFAYNLSKTWNLSRGNLALPKGGTFADLVGVAIKKTLYTGDGSYSWDREQRPHIFEQLKYVIRDVLRQRSRRTENERDAGRLEHSEIDRAAGGYDGEERMHKERERQRKLDQLETLREKIRERDDPEMFFVLEGILDGKSRSEIAEDLGIDVEDYDNARKRILRLGADVLEEPPEP